MRDLLSKLGVLLPGSVGKRIWDAEFKRGGWDYLFGLDELAHYMIIVGYVAHLTTMPRVLDVGCGNGRLFQLIGRRTFKSYTGIDLSSEAIAQIDDSSTKEATFAVADASTWEPPGSYDAIVFNEVLYYAKDPVAMLRRYAAHLSKDGGIIASMFDFPTTGRLWKKVDRAFETVDATSVENKNGRRWQVRLLRPKS